ncbi:MAG: hexitol phosphatase HxpB [Bacteroidales bacterium]|nr:hexitol phosphatase HxpB [Bacteroidales bacterium]
MYKNDKIEAVIFDLDGVLIDSEPLWKIAEKKVFQTVGVHLTEEMCRQTTGLNTLDTIKYWFKRYPWQGTSLEEVEKLLIEEVKRLIKSSGKLIPGVLQVLKLLKQKGIKMAIASGSPASLIQLVIDVFNLHEFFLSYHTCDDELYAKPHPAVYLTLAKRLDADPIHCVAVEDSFYGILSAKSARMKVIALLEEELYNNSRFDFADYKIKSYEELLKSDFKILFSN